MSSTYKIDCQRALIETLDALLNNRIGVVEASREICASRAALGQETNSLFTPFVAIDSETDKYPLGTVRELWSQEAIKRYDDERLLAEEHYGAFAVESASALLSWVRSQDF